MAVLKYISDIERGFHLILVVSCYLESQFGGIFCRFLLVLWSILSCKVCVLSKLAQLYHLENTIYFVYHIYLFSTITLISLAILLLFTSNYLLSNSDRYKIGSSRKIDRRSSSGELYNWKFTSVEASLTHIMLHVFYKVNWIPYHAKKKQYPLSSFYMQIAFSNLVLYTNRQ